MALLQAYCYWHQYARVGEHGLPASAVSIVWGSTYIGGDLLETVGGNRLNGD